jgi:hypothetical protein
MAFGDNFDCAVDHFDGGLVVDGVRRTRDVGRSLLCLCLGVARHAVRSQVRTDREVHDAQRFIATSGQLPLDEVLPDTRGITMLPALSPTQTVSRSDGKRSAPGGSP